ncbi:hypothetical protein [Methanosphaerula subterraneus]
MSQFDKLRAGAASFLDIVVCALFIGLDGDLLPSPTGEEDEWGLVALMP